MLVDKSMAHLKKNNCFKNFNIFNPQKMIKPIDFENLWDFNPRKPKLNKKVFCEIMIDLHTFFTAKVRSNYII